MKSNKLCYSLIGDNMKTDIIYTNDILLINIKGDMLESDYKKLKKKIDCIMSEYQINDIVLDLKNGRINEFFLEDFATTFCNITIKH